MSTNWTTDDLFDAIWKDDDETTQPLWQPGDRVKYKAGDGKYYEAEVSKVTGDHLWVTLDDGERWDCDIPTANQTFKRLSRRGEKPKCECGSDSKRDPGHLHFCPAGKWEEEEQRRTRPKSIK